MYSVQELSEIVSVVIGQKIEDGSFDEVIAGAVDDYLTEHPVDITALEGQTIAPAVVNASTSMSAPSGSFTSLNGESNPSVKPIYCHPITISGGGIDETRLTMLVFNNSATPFTAESLFDLINSLQMARFLVSGFFNGNNIASYIWASIQDVISIVYYNGSSNFTKEQFTSTFTIYDGVNKIN